MHTHKGLRSGSCCFLPLYPRILSLQPSHLLSVTSDIMCEMLMKYTGKSKKIIKEAISSDNFMSAAEAKKFGIVDKLDTFIA